ncbi:amino acid permease [Mycobacterium sp. 21AC1]|uniref:amino acid permease n=1 Tax=[Mycobacterium] appelbergii TaxID=2939269 RepID=UPI00293936F6|nr:amino acid permease [Mycobacterium sp. 21AC1]MDV3124070.1 amino acid permease [Mycobacterium sp. 21AC1]
MSSSTEPRSGLARSLKTRHMTMIAIGGAIGAGLFVGSGAVIQTAGPAAIISYCLAGALVLCTLRMLGEMVVAKPKAGSFADYARIGIGPWAGFTIGWLYWYYYVIIIAVEAVAGAQILHVWVGLPLWVMAMLLMAVMTVVNLISVKWFGEFEFWFASIKVAAIVAFIILGVLWVAGVWPGDTGGLGNLVAHGGFAPNGFGSILSAVVVVIFAFGGAEIVTIAAAESAEPAKSVAKATTGVIWRIILFYVGSIFLVVCILPWSDGSVLSSPYVAALDNLGIPGAGMIMNFVILTAVLSVLNSSIYTSSRILRVLASHGDAPDWLVRTDSRGVPARAVLASTAVGWISVGLAYIAPDSLFLFLVNSSGVVAIFMYVMIAVSELRVRRAIEREDPSRLTLRMWFFPYLTVAVIAAFAIVLIAMVFSADQRVQLIASVMSLIVVLIAYVLRKRYGKVPVDTEVDTEVNTVADRALDS